MNARKFKLAFTLAALTAGCAATFPYRDPDGARETLQKTTTLQKVQIKDERSWLGCGRGDLYRTKFQATNEKGQEVDGIVCKGIFKGSTIRYK